MSNEAIQGMIKELDLIAASLEEAGASDEVIDKVDIQAQKLSAYYSMEDDMYDDDDDVMDDSDDLAQAYQPMVEPPMGPSTMPMGPAMVEPPMSSNMPTNCSTPPMLEQQTTIVDPGFPVPSLPDNTSIIDPNFQAPGLGGQQDYSTMPMPVAPMMEDDVVVDDDMYDDDDDDMYGDDMYDDDDVVDYEEEVVFAKTVASVAQKLASRGEVDLSAEVLSLLSTDDED